MPGQEDHFGVGRSTWRPSSDTPPPCPLAPLPNLRAPTSALAALVPRAPKGVCLGHFHARRTRVGPAPLVTMAHTKGPSPPRLPPGAFATRKDVSVARLSPDLRSPPLTRSKKNLDFLSRLSPLTLEGPRTDLTIKLRTLGQVVT